MLKLAYFLLSLLMIPVGSAAVPNTTGGKEPVWVLADLTTLPDLAALFGHADALITLQEDKDDPEAIRPTIFIFKLQQKPKGRLNSEKAWQAYISQFIKKGRRMELGQDASKPGRYLLEFTARNPDSESDMRSLYLALQESDGSVSLFIYDSVGPSTARNLPLVKSLFARMDRKLLNDMLNADIDRRKKQVN